MKRIKSLLKSKPLYIEILRTILQLDRDNVEATPSNIAKRLDKGISTVSEPLTQMLKGGILQLKGAEDKRKNVYNIKNKSETEVLLSELEKSESLIKHKIRLASESRFILSKIENKINDKIKEKVGDISKKIQVLREYPIRTVFGDRHIDLVISSYDKIKIAIEYKIFLSEKKLRESRMETIRKLLLKKYFTEIFGNYICTEEGEINGILLVLIIPGIDAEMKIQLEDSVKKMQLRNFNINILVEDLKSNDLNSELVLNNFAENIISKFKDLRTNALRIVERKKEESTIEKYAWGGLPEIGTIHSGKFAVIGVGGAGNNVVSWLYKKDIKGADLITINSDEQHLNITEAHKKLLVGKKEFGGLGCGGDATRGERAIKENQSEIIDILKGRDLVFIIAGLGGGIGSGGTPLIAKWAKSMDILTISIVTLPFSIEKARIEKASRALKNVCRNSDTVIVIDNNRLALIAGNLPIQQMFAVANELIATMVRGVIETIVVPSLVNLDYADVKAIFDNGGFCAVGIGASDTENRADEAARGAISNPLVESSFKNATGALIYIEGGPDMTFDEVNRIGEIITEHLNEDAPVIWGAKVISQLKGKITVFTMITGLKPKILMKDYDKELSQEEINVLIKKS